MTFRLVMTKKDPRCTDFVPAGDHSGVHSVYRYYYTQPGSGGGGGVARPLPVYTSDTIPRTGGRATTTITRTDHTGDRFQVGVIEWPVRPHDHAQLVVGTRDVPMSKSGIYTSPERFTAADGSTYEWQILDARPQLVPIRTHSRPIPSTGSTAYVATFVQSESGFWLRRKYTASLFVPPEGFHILDDIVVTFIYFESKWRDKECARSRASLSISL